MMLEAASLFALSLSLHLLQRIDKSQPPEQFYSCFVSRTEQKVMSRLYNVYCVVAFISNKNTYDEQHACTRDFVPCLMFTKYGHVNSHVITGHSNLLN